VKYLSKYTEQSYAVLRIVIGVLFFIHGLQKVFGILAEAPKPVFSQFWIGGVIELVAGLLIVIGLQTRWAAFISSGMMAVGYFQFHWKFQFNEAFFPIVNRGELAVVYCFVFLLIACRGAGIWALDKEEQAD
jgi:putative oxidoreductase